MMGPINDHPQPIHRWYRCARGPACRDGVFRWGWAVRGFHTDIDRQEMTDSEVMTGATQGVILMVMFIVFSVGFGIGLASGFWWSA